jgi:alpha-L-fucosidase
MGSVGAMLAAVPRGAYPAYADAQVRELIARYRPSVLWNDIAWPSEAKLLWPLLAHYYEQVPDGVVNDRWMPWSPLLGAARRPRLQRLIDAGSRRQARKDGGIVPPRPPHFDYRTPEYVTFDDVPPDPWECVRGMDGSFGYNAESRPQDFLTQDDLRWTLVDIVAMGGNLLLNVGPRGVDAQIPDEQQALLTGLGEWMAANEDAIRSTRPAPTPAEGNRRHTARDDQVFTFARTAGGAVERQPA